MLCAIYERYSSEPKGDLSPEVEELLDLIAAMIADEIMAQEEN